MRRHSAFVLVAVAVSLTACGGAGSGAGSDGSTTPATTASTTPPPPTYPDDPSVTTGPDRSRRVTATGTVGVADVEGGCLTMTILGQGYQLIGEVAGLREGAEVTVTGYADPTIATTCQVGPAFVVLSSTPA